MAACDAHRNFLALGPCPGSELYLLWHISSSSWFPSAPKTELVLGSPGHGECGSRLWLSYLGVNALGMGLREAVAPSPPVSFPSFSLIPVFHPELALD